MSDEYILDRHANDVPLPILIVCEGYSDARFVHRLLEYKKISNCNVGWPSREGLGQGTGIDAIPKYLDGIQAITKGKEKLKGILVVADADDDPKGRFTILADGLFNASFPKLTITIPSKIAGCVLVFSLFQELPRTAHWMTFCWKQL